MRYMLIAKKEIQCSFCLKDVCVYLFESENLKFSQGSIKIYLQI